jgi:hypothetical protein
MVGMLKAPKGAFMRIFRTLLPLVIALCAIAIPATASAQVYVSFNAPPPLMQYEQPQLSNENYIWTPGYWAMGPSGYYWVSGSWQQPPQMGLLYTPGYWGYNQNQNQYNYNQGYWGQQVGYYGGVNYGYGYYGNGYNGGNWNGNQFRYNTAVSNVNPVIVRNVYIDRTVIVRNVNYTSYNGGTGGLRITPDARQQALANQHRYEVTAAQRQRVSDAAENHSNLETVIHPKPVHQSAPAAKPVHQSAPAPQHQAAAKPPQQHPAAAKPPQGKPAEKPAKPDDKTKPPA